MTHETTQLLCDCCSEPVREWPLYKPVDSLHGTPDKCETCGPGEYSVDADDGDVYVRFFPFDRP
jgi:hypothetical protein